MADVDDLGRVASLPDDVNALVVEGGPGEVDADEGSRLVTRALPPTQQKLACGACASVTSAIVLPATVFGSERSGYRESYLGLGMRGTVNRLVHTARQPSEARLAPTQSRPLGISGRNEYWALGSAGIQPGTTLLPSISAWSGAVVWRSGSGDTEPHSLRHSGLAWTPLSRHHKSSRSDLSCSPERRLVSERKLLTVSFAVGTDAYDRFMGRYSTPLAPVFAEFASVVEGLHVLDVGCGPGALTDELVKRVGPGAVAAVDPSQTFLRAVQERNPAVDTQRATAEALPFEDRTFDTTLAQLVVHFMKEPIVGLREMARVTRRGGVVAACVWDHEGGGGPLSLFWDAVRELDRDVEGEAQLAGARAGHLAQLFREAGLASIDDTSLSITVTHPSFEDWWEPFTFGVGPAGSYVAALDATSQIRLRDQSRDMLPSAPFTLSARAWAARGLAL